MRYINASMTSGEHLIATFRLHWVEWVPVFASFFVSAAILMGWWTSPWRGEPIAMQAAVLFALAAVLFGLWRNLMLSTLEFGLTNRRVVYKAGFIWRDTKEMPLESIEAVVIHQSIIARILGFGNVRVTGKTAGVSDVSLRNVRRPLECKRQIENQRYGGSAESPAATPATA